MRDTPRSMRGRVRTSASWFAACANLKAALPLYDAGQHSSGGASARWPVSIECQFSCTPTCKSAKISALAEKR